MRLRLPTKVRQHVQVDVANSGELTRAESVGFPCSSTKRSSTAAASRNVVPAQHAPSTTRRDASSDANANVSKYFEMSASMMQASVGQLLSAPPRCLMRVSLRSESKRIPVEVGLEQRLQQEFHRRLHHAVADVGYPQRPRPSTSFGIQHVGAGPGRYVFARQFLLQFLQQRLTRSPDVLGGSPRRPSARRRSPTRAQACAVTTSR